MRKRHVNSCSRVLVLLLTAACVGSTITGCGQGEDTEEAMSEVIPVQVQAPEMGKLTLKNEFMGTISPQESVYVLPMVSAEVLSTEISVGDTVEAGQILCKLDSEAAELQLASAQAQYDSVAASVNSAQVGYEIAQAQYEGTVAQLDAQMGGQKNLQLYQLQMNVDSVQDGIDDIYEAIDDLEKDRADLKEDKDDYKAARDRAAGTVAQAQAAVSAAQDLVTAYDNAEYFDSSKQYTVWAYQNGIKTNTVLQNYTDAAGIEAYQADMAKAKEQLSSAQSALQQVQGAVAQYDSAYEQAKAGLDAYDDSREDLEEKLADTYGSLTDAEAIFNITAEQVYGDTQKVVDANKKTAALGVDSAAASVNAAQVGMEGAQVAIDSAEYQLDMYTLTAPISGTVEAVNVEAHDFASPGNPAFVISNRDTMTITFYVSEGIRNTLYIGQKVQAERNGKLYDAAITEIGSMIDQTTGLFAVKACVSAPDESLLTGCSVKVIADTYSQDNALLIPYDAVYYDDSQPYVYVAVNNIVERRDIETGIFDENTITVLAGLTTEDQIITSWSANLRDGAEISILTEEQAAEDTAAIKDTAEENGTAAEGAVTADEE